MRATGYLIQATLVSFWWIGMLINQNFYDAFQFPSISKNAFNALLIPDLVVIALLSVARAYSHKKELEYIILGGFSFATLYCVNAMIITKGGFLPTTIMLLGLAYNFFLIAENKVFRVANSNNLYINLAKTAVQIFCVWIITLILFPLIIMNAFGLTIPAILDLNPIGHILFLAFSLLGCYSAVVMVRKGRGTPLPLDQTQKLVISGPYKFVRNPMAISGIGQAISISIMTSSIHILIYALLGAILWEFVVRPLEEQDMTKRFGKEYSEYKAKVKCWIPSFRKFI